MSNYPRIKNKRVLVTGGAGFIGSNLCEDLLKYDNEVVCLDNFSTGRKENLEEFKDHKNFKLIVGDIRNIEDCKKALDGIEIVLHEAALGSVPRSIDDPATTNAVNISGFLNMLIAARDAGIKRFVYAASSSTYGDSESLPKVEEIIGKPLSPYAVTKYVNELYAHVFALNYGMETIGLRYFNVYGRRQDPNDAYAAVTTNPDAISQIFNTAVGERNDLNQMTELLKKYLSDFDPKIKDIQIIHGPDRKGDIPHSLASIEKAKKILGYQPEFNFEKGLKLAVDWY